ncbi:MAG: RDD family protein [Acidobacteria bacterium]|nr:RDD family protein [Acidobacteriota bacterium]MBV9437221.1 RDD family protein [Acidobacteriota bacterium]
MSENFDKLIIDTPEQVQLEFPLAGIGSRFLALFVDSLIQFVVVSLLIIALALLGAGVSFSPESSKWILALYIFVAFVLYWGYFAVFEALWKGQTPGKRKAGIRVIRDFGREIGVKEAIGRNLLRSVDMLPGVYAVGLAAMFLNPQNKRLGDFVAGTVVVHDRPPEESQPFWNTREDASAVFVGIDKITAEEVQMVETFLLRRLDLSQTVREQTAKRIADHLCTKLQVTDAEKSDLENFLELVVRQFRKSARYR